jgi:hypothetical protein
VLFKLLVGDFLLERSYHVIWSGMPHLFVIQCRNEHSASRIHSAFRGKHQYFEHHDMENEAFMMTALWAASWGQANRMSVTSHFFLSFRQLHEGRLADPQHQLPCHQIQLEYTEKAFVSNAGQAFGKGPSRSPHLFFGHQLSSLPLCALLACKVVDQRGEGSA